MALHKNLTGEELHSIQAFEYANSTARTTATGLTSLDIGKVAKQTSNGSYWILTDPAPIWLELTSTSSVEVGNRLTVGKSGAVDFNNIRDAADYAISLSPDENNLISITVYPGVYVEDNPITIPIGVSIGTPSFLAHRTVVVQPQNSLDDLFVLTGGELGGIYMEGVSDPGKALVRVNAPELTTILRGISITNCDHGIIIENGSVVDIAFFLAEVNDISSTIDHAIHVDGINTRLLLDESKFLVKESILGSFTTNPIKIGVHVTNGAEIDLHGVDFKTFYYDENQVSVLIDAPNSLAKISGCNLSDGYVGLKISSSGSNASCAVEATSIYNYITNVQIDSSTGKLFGEVTSDGVKSVLVPGAKVYGTLYDRQNESTNMIGSTYLDFESGRRQSLSEFIFDQSSSGSYSGGAVTAIGGLDINISDGYGNIRRTLEQDLTDVSWTSSNLTLSPNTTNYIHIDAETLLIDNSISGFSPNDIQLAIVYTDSSNIRFIHNVTNIVRNQESNLHDYLIATRTFALNTGLAASQGSTNTQINIDSGSYYRAITLINFDGYSDAYFSYFYDGGNTEISDQSDIDLTQYDNGGLLTTMDDGYYRADTIYITSDGRVSLIYGNSQYDDLPAAQAASKMSAPSFIEPSGFSIANVIVEKNVGINSFVDKRAIPSAAVVGSVGGGGGVSDHGLLSGLSDDDHSQYLLVNGARGMAGSLDMGSHNIINVSLVDGIYVNNHGSRHNPGQVDAIATDNPITILVGAAINGGSAASVSRSDHQHGIGSATPVTINAANAEGTASTVSRSDHQHAHGNLAGGSTHALVISDPGGTAGYMLPSDKQKLDGIASGATNTPLSSIIPVNVSKSAASAGVSAEASRQDHKHNIDTGVPISISTSNSEGTATTLARSDHVHRGTLLQTTFAEITANTTTSSLTFVDLLTQSITTTGGDLLIYFTVSASNTTVNRSISFRITVDAVSKRGTNIFSPSANTAASASIAIKVTGLSASTHTVKVQWLTSANTARIDPAGAPDTEHASLIVNEVTV